MGGLGWWTQTQWVQRQRSLWREHDAKLAAVWHDEVTDAADDTETSAVIVLPDVIVCPEGGSSVAAGVS